MDHVMGTFPHLGGVMNLKDIPNNGAQSDSYSTRSSQNLNHPIGKACMLTCRRMIHSLKGAVSVVLSLYYLGWSPDIVRLYITLFKSEGPHIPWECLLGVQIHFFLFAGWVAQTTERPRQCLQDSLPGSIIAIGPAHARHPQHGPQMEIQDAMGGLDWCLYSKRMGTRYVGQMDL